MVSLPTHSAPGVIPVNAPPPPSLPVDHLPSAVASSAVVAAMEPCLAVVLRLSWAAGTLPILLACLRLPGAGLLGFAVRGKIMQPSSRKFTVTHRYFLHFYAVAVVLTTCLALSTWFYAYRKMIPLTTEPLHYSTVASHLTGGSHMLSFDKSQFTPIKYKYRVWQSVFVLLLMEAQVLRHLHETLHVFSYSSSAQMHILGYLTGLLGMMWELSIGLEYISIHPSSRKQPRSLSRGTRRSQTGRLLQRSSL